MGLEVGIWALRLGFRPGGWDLGLEDRILALRIGFWPRAWDLGLQKGIWALSLGFEAGGGGDREEEAAAQKWILPNNPYMRFINWKNGVSETQKMAFLKPKKWCF